MMYDAGIKEIFTPGVSLEAIVEWVRNNIHAR
jgi:methylmalonyl-CoA mutase cobalamin-binding subunit